MKNNSGMNRRRILHTSDLHLASCAEKDCRILRGVVQLAEASRVDLVLIAGDLFESNAVEDDLVSFVAEQLGNLSACVAILPGNHDCLDQDSVFHRSPFRGNHSNIRVLKEPQGETLHWPDLGISLWGRPIISENIRPLDGLPRPELNGHWNIAAAHGYYVSSAASAALFPSYHISREEIINSRRDYIALGHVPVFKCVCEEPVKAFYSGSPSFGGTVAIVDLDEETGIRATCHSLFGAGR